MLYKKIIFGAAFAVLTAGLVACAPQATFTEVEDKVPEVQLTPPDTRENNEISGISTPVADAKTYTSMFESDLAQFRLPGSGDIVVTMVTNYGDIDILLFPEVAPKAVENFTNHSINNYYDGIIFHRVINNFMIQGGDPTGTGRGGESIWGTNFEDEFSIDYFPLRGSLAMANAGSGTNGSQFFIVQSRDYSEQWDAAMVDFGFDEKMIEAHRSLGGTPFLFNKHTVFGQVVKGMDVVDTIAAVEVGTADKPVKDVVIEDILVTTLQ